MSTRTPLRFGAAVGLVGLLTFGVAQLPVTHAAAKPTWLTYVAKTKIAKLTVIAADTSPSSFDFDGYSKGKMTFTVPVGTKVVVTFTNKGSLPHSLEFVKFSATPPVSAPAPAFKGAFSPNYLAGTPKGTKPQTITFIANKAGKYMMICAVPGHALAGMWENFVVSSSVKAATVAIAK